MVRFDSFQQITKECIVKKCILSPLQHKGAKAKRIAIVTALQNLVGIQAVALAVTVASADAAIKAIVFTLIADFDKASDEHAVSVDLAAQTARQIGGVGGKLFGVPFDQGLVFVKRQRVRKGKPIDQLQKLFTHALVSPNKPS